jgi:hypothetical protein
VHRDEKQLCTAFGIKRFSPGLFVFGGLFLWKRDQIAKLRSEAGNKRRQQEESPIYSLRELGSRVGITGRRHSRYVLNDCFFFSRVESATDFAFDCVRLKRSIFLRFGLHGS